MDQLGLKDSSRDFTVNCAISFLFRLHLMLHACVARFDVMFWDENFWELNTPLENQTARGRWQWKKRCASSSTAPQAAQCLSM
jgi:hypothetical protein